MHLPTSHSLSLASFSLRLFMFLIPRLPFLIRFPYLSVNTPSLNGCLSFSLTITFSFSHPLYLSFPVQSPLTFTHLPTYLFHVHSPSFTCFNSNPFLSLHFLLFNLTFSFAVLSFFFPNCLLLSLSVSYTPLRHSLYLHFLFLPLFSFSLSFPFSFRFLTVLGSFPCRPPFSLSFIMLYTYYFSNLDFLFLFISS